MTETTAHHGPFRSTDLHADDTEGSGRPVVLIHGWPLSGEAFAANVPAGSQLHLVAGAPHGVNVSDADEWNRVVVDVLGR